MRMVKIYRPEGRPILNNVFHARNMWQRLRGLIGRPQLGENEGLLISPCNSVHTIGMRHALDIVFLDKHGTVLKCVEALKPFRMAGTRRARHTLELQAGTIARKQIKTGDRLAWESVTLVSQDAAGPNQLEVK